jgi:two-component system CheB/CheR fusion protein
VKRTGKKTLPKEPQPTPVAARQVKKEVERKAVKKKVKPLRYIVGMGGSAGALEAFTQFFSAMPPDSGLSFVLVPHLDPTHKGIMPELLQRVTKMKVVQAEDGMRVMPNSVYVIPSNKELSILHSVLQLMEPSAPRGLRLPIDFFFRSLAEDQKDRAICVILSGMGTDGTLGLKAIKERLGMVMVQDPSSAKFDGMPRSAVETGMVDYAPDRGDQLLPRPGRLRRTDGEGTVETDPREKKGRHAAGLGPRLLHGRGGLLHGDHPG